MGTNLRERLAQTREELQLAAHRRDLDELVRLLEICEDLNELIQLEEGQTSYGIAAITAQDIYDHWAEEQRLAPGPATEPHIAALTNDIQRPKPPHWVVTTLAILGTLLVLGTMFLAFFL
jgi:hypothetical protein